MSTEKKGDIVTGFLDATLAREISLDIDLFDEEYLSAENDVRRGIISQCEQGLRSFTTKIMTPRQAVKIFAAAVVRGYGVQFVDHNGEPSVLSTRLLIKW